MESEQKYIRDLSEIRSMMERSSRFLSLSGLSGILAGLYALGGAYFAHAFYNFSVGSEAYEQQQLTGEPKDLFQLALAILVLSVGTAILLSWKKSKKTGEKIWNSAARRLAFNMAIPLFAGGIFILILFSRDLLGLIAPVMLIFYGLALLNASKFTYEEVRSLGIIEIVLGLFAAYYVEFGLLLWAIGFGIMHIMYGVYMHLKYEK